MEVSRDRTAEVFPHPSFSAWRRSRMKAAVGQSSGSAPEASYAGRSAARSVAPNPAARVHGHISVKAAGNDARGRRVLALMQQI
jgi:hypothetical protein